MELVAVSVADVADVVTAVVVALVVVPVKRHQTSTLERLFLRIPAPSLYGRGRLKGSPPCQVQIGTYLACL